MRISAACNRVVRGRRAHQQLALVLFEFLQRVAVSAAKTCFVAKAEVFARVASLHRVLLAIWCRRHIVRSAVVVEHLNLSVASRAVCQVGFYAYFVVVEDVGVVDALGLVLDDLRLAHLRVAVVVQSSVHANQRVVWHAA